jgi:hypothetical protein
MATRVLRSGWRGNDWLFPMRPLDLLAIGLSALWFTYSLTRPDAYNGRRCCDSVEYMHLAGELHSPSDILTHYGFRALGYPLFLRFHSLVERVLPLPAGMDWIFLSLLTAFVLFVASTYALYFALRDRGIPVPRAALLLLLVHPGLSSYAATPITDSLALSLLSFCFACFLRLEWTVERRALIFSAAIGLLLAWLTLTRPPHYVPSLAVLSAFLAAGIGTAVRRRSPRLVLLPLLGMLAFGIVLLPRHLACASQNGGVPCLLTSQHVTDNIRLAIGNVRIGARTYGLLFVDDAGHVQSRQSTVPDVFMQRHFDCLGSNGPTLAGILACYRQRLIFLPLYFGKKTIALFDNPHLNAYASFITSTPVWWWNRLFGGLGFAGFACLVLLAAWSAARRDLPFQVLLPLLYLAAYYVLILIPHIEARFGFPFVPASFVALTIAVKEAFRSPGVRRAVVVGVIAAACIVFLAQTVAWDRVDPLFVSPPAHRPI